MIPRLKRDDDALPVARSTDLVDGWLKVFLGLLKHPAAQADGIREELEGHLRERVRDLMVSGVAEGEATRQAISELGEAADVAARYRALRNEPRRRFMMHATLFTVAGAALALSVAAFRGGQPPAPGAAGPVDQAAADRAQDTRKVLLDVLGNGGAEARRQVIADMLARIEPRNLELSPEHVSRVMDLLRHEANGSGSPASAVYEAEPVPRELAGLKADWSLKSAPASDAFVFLGKAANLPVNVRWNLLTPESGLEPGKPMITMQAKGAGVGAFLREVNEAVGAKGEGSVDLRVSDGVLEVATRGYFDRRERELVSYDLSGIIAARMATYNETREKVVEEVSHVIAQFVSPEEWRDNGGELGEMTVVGDRLFVNAPARFHPQIRWILEQLPTGKAHSDAAPGKAQDPEVPVTRAYALKHAAASETLNVLRTLESIRAIDFNRVATDLRTNSVVATALPSQHLALQVALDCLDRPAERTKGEMENPERPAPSGETRKAIEAEPAIVRTRQDLSTLQSDLVTARARFGPDHPTILRLRTMIQEKEQDLASAREKRFDQ